MSTLVRTFRAERAQTMFLFGLRCGAVILAATLLSNTAAAQPANLSGMDADRDGRITRVEYRNGLIGQSMKYDKDGDGRLTRAELPMVARLPGAKGIVARIFKVVDSDGDGAMSNAELGARAEARFSELDTSGDGALDSAETKAARQRR